MWMLGCPQPAAAARGLLSSSLVMQLDGIDGDKASGNQSRFVYLPSAGMAHSFVFLYVDIAPPLLL